MTDIIGQISNAKAGVWSDPALWSNNLLPTAADDVLLNFDITVDINAACKSLTTNGHIVTVSSGCNLYILGSNNTAGSSLLKLYIELDTTKPAPSDTLRKFQLSYDYIKGLIRVDSKDFPGNNSAVTSIFYNGLDTVPFKPLITQLR